MRTLIQLLSYLLVIRQSLQLIWISPEDSITLVEGKRFITTCNDNTKNPNQLEWIGPGRKNPITQEGRKKITYRQTQNSESLELLFKKLLVKDKGNYTCRKMDGGSKTLYINIIPPVNFSGTPNKIYTKSGSKARVTCAVKADPKPRNIIWFHRGKRIQHNGKYEIAPEEPETLTIHNIHDKEAGIYTCKVEQITRDASITHTKNILIEVTAGPSLLNREIMNNIFNINDKVTLSCTVKANPIATITWYHKNQKVSTDTMTNITHTPNHSQLEVRLNHLNKFGKYSCKATNREGMAEKYFFINSSNWETLQTNIDTERKYQENTNTTLTATMPSLTINDIASTGNALSLALQPSIIVLCLKHMRII